MSFSQLRPRGPGGFSQIMSDAENPAARAYATHMLRQHGIQVPHGVDPTAMWRAYSAKLAGARNTALVQGPDPYDSGVSPTTPLVSSAPPRPQVPMGGPPMAGPPRPQVPITQEIPLHPQGGGIGLDELRAALAQIRQSRASGTGGRFVE